MTMKRGVIKIKYAVIREMDISNGEGIGIALFVQGCHFHCYNCFNEATWDFDGGKEWTESVKIDFLSLADEPYIKRISILGGEPLAQENLDGILDLIKSINKIYGDAKKIWLYTGYTYEQLISNRMEEIKLSTGVDKIYETVNNVDILVDGLYIDKLRDITLKWRGSSNQRVIDVQSTLRNEIITLYNGNDKHI